MAHYASSGNGAEAARQAGVPAASARQAASRWLTKADIQQALRARRQEWTRQHQVRASAVIGLLYEQMTVGIGKVLEADGRFDLAAARQRGVAHLVRKYRQRERRMADGTVETSTELELYDSQAAAVRLSRLLGLEYKKEKDPREIGELAIAEMMERMRARGAELSREEAILKLEALIPEVALCES